MFDSEKQPGVKLTPKNTDVKHWMGSNWKVTGGLTQLDCSVLTHALLVIPVVRLIRGLSGELIKRLCTSCPSAVIQRRLPLSSAPLVGLSTDRCPVIRFPPSSVSLSSTTVDTSLPSFQRALPKLSTFFIYDCHMSAAKLQLSSTNPRLRSFDSRRRSVQNPLDGHLIFLYSLTSSNDPTAATTIWQKEERRLFLTTDNLLNPQSALLVPVRSVLVQMWQFWKCHRGN